MWNETCEFDILNPDVAMIRMVVYDEDMFGDPNFLGQATYPVTGLKTGWNFPEIPVNDCKFRFLINRVPLCYSEE